MAPPKNLHALFALLAIQSLAGHSYAERLHNLPSQNPRDYDPPPRKLTYEEQETVRLCSDDLKNMTANGFMYAPYQAEEYLLHALKNCPQNTPFANGLANHFSGISEIRDRANELDRFRVYAMLIRLEDNGLRDSLGVMIKTFLRSLKEGSTLPPDSALDIPRIRKAMLNLHDTPPDKRTDQQKILFDIIFSEAFRKLYGDVKTAHLRHLVLRGEIPKVDKPKYNTDPASPDFVLAGLDKVSKSGTVSNFLKKLLADPYSLNFEGRAGDELNRPFFDPDPESPQWAEQKKYLEGLSIDEAVDLAKWMKERMIALEKGDFADPSHTGSRLMSLYTYFGRAIEILDHAGYKKDGTSYTTQFAKTGRERDYGAETISAHEAFSKTEKAAQNDAENLAYVLPQAMSSMARAKIAAMPAEIRSLINSAVRARIPLPEDAVHDPTPEKLLRAIRAELGYSDKRLPYIEGILVKGGLTPPFRPYALSTYTLAEREELRRWIREELITKNKEGNWVRKEGVDPTVAQALVLFLDYVDGINDRTEESRRLRGGDAALVPAKAIEIMVREANAEAHATPLAKKRVKELLEEAKRNNRSVPALTRYAHFQLDNLHQQMLDDLEKTFNSPTIQKYGTKDLLKDFAKVLRSPDTRSIDENYQKWLPQRYQAMAEAGLVPNGDRIEFAARKEEETAQKLIRQAYAKGTEETLREPLFDQKPVLDIISRLKEPDNLRNRYAAYRALVASNFTVAASIERNHPGDVNSQVAAISILGGQVNGKKVLELVDEGQTEPITRALYALHDNLGGGERPDFEKMIDEGKHGELDAFIARARLHHNDFVAKSFERERQIVEEEALASAEEPELGEPYGLDAETFGRLRELYGRAVRQWEVSSGSLVGDLETKKDSRLVPLKKELADKLIRTRTEGIGQEYKPDETAEEFRARAFEKMTSPQIKKFNDLVAQHGVLRVRAVHEYLSELDQTENHDARLGHIEKILKKGISAFIEEEGTRVDDEIETVSREITFKTQQVVSKAVAEVEKFKFDSSTMTAAEYEAEKKKKQLESAATIAKAAEEKDAELEPARVKAQKAMDALARLGMVSSLADAVDRRGRYDSLAHDILQQTFGNAYNPLEDEGDIDELMRLSLALEQHGQAENEVQQKQKAKYLPGFAAGDASAVAGAKDFTDSVKPTLDNPERLIAVHGDDVKRIESVAKERAIAEHNAKTKKLNELLEKLAPLNIKWTGEGVDWRDAALTKLNPGPEGNEFRAWLKQLSEFTPDGHNPYEKLVADINAIHDGRGRPTGAIKLINIDTDGDGEPNFNLNNGNMVRFDVRGVFDPKLGRMVPQIELHFMHTKTLEDWMPQLHKDLYASRDNQFRLTNDKGKFWSHTLPRICGELPYNKWIGNTFTDENGLTDVEYLLKSEEGSMLRMMEYLRRAGDAEYNHNGKTMTARDLLADMQLAQRNLNIHDAHINEKVLADIDAFEQGVYLAAATVATAGVAAYVSSPTMVVGAYLARANQAGRLLWVTKNLKTLSEAGRYGYQVAKITLASKALGTGIENGRRAYEIYYELARMTPEERRNKLLERDSPYRHLDLNGDGEIDEEWWAIPAFHEVFNETKIAFMSFGASRFLNNPIAKIGVNRWLVQPTSVGISSFLVNSGETFRNHYRHSGEIGASLNAAWAQAPSTAFQSVKMAGLSGAYDQEFARLALKWPLFRMFPPAWNAAGVNRLTTAAVATGEYLYHNGNVSGSGLTNPIGGRKFTGLMDYVGTELANNWYSDYKAGRGAISPDGARKSTDMLYHDPNSGISPFAKILAEQNKISPKDPDYVTKARKLEIAETAKGKPITESHEIAEALGMIRVKDLTSGKFPNSDGLIKSLASAEGIPEKVMRDYLNGLGKKTGSAPARYAKTVFTDSGNTSVYNALLSLRAKQISKFRADLKAQGGTPNFSSVSNKPWVYQTLYPSDLTNNAAYTQVIKQTANDHGITDPAQVQAFIKEVRDYKKTVTSGKSSKSTEPTIGALAAERARQLGLTPVGRWQLDLR